MAKTGPKIRKIPLFSHLGQNMQLRNKSHKIKKFQQVVIKMMQLFIFFPLFSQEMAETSSNMVKIQLCTPGGQNMQQWKRVITLKSFAMSFKVISTNKDI